MIDVALTPGAVRAADVAVVVDVLRATSTVTQALSSGYRRILCVDTVERAAGLRGTGCVLAGERNCLKPAGFDQGNSPAEARQRRGEVLVLATTNGAPAVVAAARHAPTVLVASLLNLDAVLTAIEGPDVPHHCTLQVICSGANGAVALEDVYLAGRLCAALSGRHTDSALVAAAVARSYDSPLQAVSASAHAMVLRAAGLEADVIDCSAESTIDVVPYVVASNGSTAVVAQERPVSMDGAFAAAGNRDTFTAS